MTKEGQKKEIKGILVHFFRSGTNEDYNNALNTAITEIQTVKNLALSGVSQCFAIKEPIIIDAMKACLSVGYKTT